MSVSQRAWDVLMKEKEELETQLAMSERSFALVDAQVARCWNHIGQLSKQNQDLIDLVREQSRTLNDPSPKTFHVVDPDKEFRRIDT